MSLPIYDTIGRIYGWQNMPKNDAAAPFFGFSGCTRSNLESVLLAMRSDSGAGVGLTAAARQSYFARIAWDISAATGADYNGLIKFCNWVFVAANKDSDVMDWLGGESFTTIDYIVKTITDTVSDKAQAAAETIEYGIEKETAAGKTIFDRVLPVIGIVAACYLVKKVLD